MSNDSNRDDSNTISPGELKASDFFPPGTGWNAAPPTPEEIKQKASDYERECQQDDSAIKGAPRH